MYLPEKPDTLLHLYCTPTTTGSCSEMHWNGTCFPLKWDIFPAEMGHVSHWNGTCFPLKWDMFPTEMGHVSRWNGTCFPLCLECRRVYLLTHPVTFNAREKLQYYSIVGLKCIFQAFEFLPACRESQIKNENLLAKTPSPTCF